MKLYFSPGACSLAPHIALGEAGLNVDLVRVDLATHRLDDGRDFHGINRFIERMAQRPAVQAAMKAEGLA